MGVDALSFDCSSFGLKFICKVQAKLEEPLLTDDSNDGTLPGLHTGIQEAALQASTTQLKLVSLGVRWSTSLPHCYAYWH